MKLIIAYKLGRALLAAGLAVWVIRWPDGAMNIVARFASELSDTHSILSRLGAWIQARLSPSRERTTALLLSLDAAASCVEGLLLLSGRPWAEWVVVGSLGLLIPFELLTLEARPSVLKLVVVTVNVAVVGYLVRERLRARRPERK